MNREEVIRMAREAGLLVNPLLENYAVLVDGFPVEIERFAELVAAAERRKHQSDIEHWKAQAAQAEKWRGMAHARHCDSQKVVQEIQREAMELERDACAIACEAHATSVINDGKQPAWAIANECAAAIRARGMQPKD